MVVEKSSGMPDLCRFAESAVFDMILCNFCESWLGPKKDSQSWNVRKCGKLPKIMKICDQSWNIHILPLDFARFNIKNHHFKKSTFSYLFMHNVVIANSELRDNHEKSRNVMRVMNKS